MRTSCGCGYDADPRVFGPCRDCKPKPTSIPWPEERPYEQTLSDGDGDLG